MTIPSAADEGRRCVDCGLFKVWSDFYTDKTKKNGYQSKCKVCRRAERKERWRNNTNGHRDKDFERRANRTEEEKATFIHGQFVYRLNRDFHITEGQYNWLLEQQGGVCFLCKEPETKIHHRNGTVMRLAVDHDHRCCPESSKSCGKCIRSLLCYSCNMLMGKVELKPALAERFKDYIDRRPLEPEKTSFEAVRELLGREPCWNFGKNHLCNPKCENDPPFGTTLANVREYYDNNDTSKDM